MSTVKIETLEKFNVFVQSILDAINKTHIDWSRGGAAYYDALGGAPNADNFWAWRELLRTYDLPALKDIFKCYAPPVFGDEPWVNKLHFVHVCQDDNSMVAFTPDAEKGRRDVRIKMTVGKYLTKYHMDDLKATVSLTAITQFRENQRLKATTTSGALRKVKDYTDVPDDEIREILATEVIKQWADKHRERVEEGTVLFASTREECSEVYLNGPSSCMDAAHKSTYHPNTGGIHPAEMYAGPDTVIAYTRRGGKINARTVCHIGVNPPRFTRVYGDATIATRLQAMGFVESYSTSGARGLDGARLLKQVSPVNPENYIMPYLDAPAQYLRMEGDYIVVSKASTDSPGATQYGSVYVENSASYVPCTCCGTKHNPKRMHTVMGGGLVCGLCLDSDYIYGITDTNTRREEYFPITEAIRVDGVRYHISIDLIANGFVLLRDGSYTKASKAVRHYLDGFIKNTTSATKCGIVDGVPVYALAEEITEDWGLTGEILNAALVPPGVTESTVGAFIQRVVSESRGVRNTEQAWAVVIALLQHTGGEWVDSVGYDLYKAYRDATPTVAITYAA